jgi:Tetratricopeptide repeat
VTAAEHGQQLDVQQEGGLRLRQWAGSYLWRRGQYRQALALDEQTLTRRQQVLGDDHPDTLASMNNLAATRHALGDLDGAHQLGEQALAARRRALGDDHPDTLLSMNNLAAVRRDLEKQ